MTSIISVSQWFAVMIRNHHIQCFNRCSFKYWRETSSPFAQSFRARGTGRSSFAHGRHLAAPTRK
jgi:hypothetical protein